MSLEPSVRFPIACPRCMRETLFHIPLKSITEALVTSVRRAGVLRGGCKVVVSAVVVSLGHAGRSLS
jgi:hypothetical protein